jgi:hypothetical protein
LFFNHDDDMPSGFISLSPGVADPRLDTDILALVEIERNSRHKFEFFMGPVGLDQPISAKMAYAFAKAGGKIYHGLSDFEARMRQPNQVGDDPPLV